MNMYVDATQFVEKICVPHKANSYCSLGNQGLTRQSSPQTAGMIFPTDKKRSIRTPNDLFITQDII